ncbi:TPA: AAA family ATPase [Candidatus Galligastranaerophilus gallistercoris]|nr:AAA family ATPase [Candidatus Galligastranaerophilus gallistercoris]
MNALIETFNNQNNEKMQKPNFDTKIGREFLAFYLQTKFKQIVNYDKKNKEHLFIDIKEDFIPNFLNRLVNYPDKKILIGITGESASGKSTICNEIQRIIDTYKMPITIINADNYFRDISDLIKKYGSFDILRDNGHDVDAPENFRLELLKEHAQKLKDGKDIKAPKYLTNGTGVSVLNATDVKSNKIVVIEGMATMFEPVRDVFDIKIYVEACRKTRKKRFLERAKFRNQDMENAIKHWGYVEGAGIKYIKPAKEFSDIVVNGEADLEYFTQVIEYINHITNSFECAD